MDRHCQNARALAVWLQDDSRIGRVYFPGLAESDREKAARVLPPDHFGALVSIELKDNTRAAAFRFMDKLQLCLPATTLGDVFSQVSYPPISSHRDLSDAERQNIGITEGCMRMSVGIEDVNDIIKDLDQALA